jgi:hypothetical protein
MKKVLFILLAFSSNAFPSDYDICYVAGYFAGADQDYYLDLAVKEAVEISVMGTPLCSSAWIEAKDTGEYVSKNGEYRNKSDKRIAFLAFKYKDSIINLTTKTERTSPRTLPNYEKGELAGSLGFNAMTIDAYYETCYSKGIVTNNNFNGVNKLIKEKWGIDYSKITNEQKKRTGRNFKQEAHTLIKKAVEKNGGCNTGKMKAWFKNIQTIYEKNLDKFHAS